MKMMFFSMKFMLGNLGVSMKVYVDDTIRPDEFIKLSINEIKSTLD